MRLTLRLLLALILSVYASLGFATAPPSELNQSELSKLANRELIVHSKNISSCPWPELTVFALIDVTPVEAAALFSNYQDQKNYIPNLIKSDLARKVAENEMIVDFEMHLPWPLANSKYSTGNIFSRLENNEYQICWYLVKSDSLIDTKGTVQFIPYATKTLLKYQALVHPDSKLASILSSQAKSRVSRTVQAIVTYIEETKKSQPDKVQELVKSLHK